MKNTMGKIKKKILDEEKEILFIKKISQKKMKNFLNRMEKDIYNSHKYSLSNIISSILSDIDNIEKAIALSKKEKNFSSISVELEKILNLFLDLFKKYQVVKIDDINIPLDPTIHQAIALSNSKEINSNYIIQVMQKGYKLYDRVLRPAMVIVSH